MGRGEGGGGEGGPFFFTSLTDYQAFNSAFASLISTFDIPL